MLTIHSLPYETCVSVGALQNLPIQATINGAVAIRDHEGKSTHALLVRYVDGGREREGYFSIRTGSFLGDA